MQETEIIKKPHKHRPTIRATDRQIERLRQQSALIHAELHKSGAFHLIIDPALALEITQALGEWIKINEEQLASRKRNHELEQEEIDHHNFYTTRMRLALRDWELAIEAASRASTLPREKTNHVQDDESRNGPLRRVESYQPHDSACAQPTVAAGTTGAPDETMEARHAARYTIPLYGRR